MKKYIKIHTPWPMTSFRSVHQNQQRAETENCCLAEKSWADREQRGGAEKAWPGWTQLVMLNVEPGPDSSTCASFHPLLAISLQRLTQHSRHSLFFSSHGTCSFSVYSNSNGGWSFNPCTPEIWNLQHVARDRPVTSACVCSCKVFIATHKQVY